jgi:hypothetical protein
MLIIALKDLKTIKRESHNIRAINRINVRELSGPMPA